MSNRSPTLKTLRLPRWMYLDRGRYVYRGPTGERDARSYIPLGRDLEAARRKYAEITKHIDRPIEIGQRPILGARRSGFVYFLRCGKDGPFKIGFSGTVYGIRSRITAIKTGSPYPIVLIGYAQGSTEDEHRLHVRLDRHRSHGEWFHANEQVISAISAALAAGEIHAPAALRSSDISPKSFSST